MINLANLVHANARRIPTATALCGAGRSLLYSEFAREVRRVAALLASCGVEPCDRVGVMIPNRPEFTIAYFAILHCGAIVVPINVLFVADEVANLLTDSGARVFVAWDALSAAHAGFAAVSTCQSLVLAGLGSDSSIPAGAVRFDAAPSDDGADLHCFADSPPASTQSDDTAVILYTSGTTGRPKGAELTHFNLYENARFVSERQFSRWPVEVEVLGPGHVGLAVLPLSHSFGQTAIQNALLFNGGAIQYLERFDAEAALTAIGQARVTVFAGVPTMYFAMLGVPDATRRFDWSSLRFCVSGGAALPIEVKRQFEARFRVNIQEAYGLSETSPLACTQSIDATAKAGSIGQPIWGCEMRVADESGNSLPVGEPGEILIRGTNILKGYYRRLEATAEAMRGGWFHSGDIGQIDADGDFSIVDRKKDLSIRGGFNVYPREVEEVLYKHPAVREAAVIGVADPKYGEEVVAVVAFHAGQHASPEEIIAFCKQRLAAYKYPRRVELRDALPKGPTGKILRRALRLP